MEEKYMENIRGYVPKNYQAHTSAVWNKLPVARRALVFILLFLGLLGELRVVLTKRSSRLRNFPGHISLPGGKADSTLELPWMVSRREMSEEIGLSEHDEFLSKNYGFTIDHVNELPCYLSRTFSAVKPCVGFMNKRESVDLLNMKLRVNPGESTSIFSCPLRDFLFPAADDVPKEALERTHYLVKWGGIPWHLRSYTFLQENNHEVDWLKGFDDLSATESETDVDEQEKKAQTPPPSPSVDCTTTKRRKKNLSEWGKLGSRRDSETNQKIYDVWGLTANILHDLAEVVYHGRTKNRREVGEEELIWSLFNNGQLQGKERSPEESKLISSTPTDSFTFGEVLPRTEFNRLKRLYKI